MSTMEIYLLMALVSAAWGCLLGIEIGGRLGWLAKLGCGALGAVTAVVLFVSLVAFFDWFGNLAIKVRERNRGLGVSLVVLCIFLIIVCIGLWLALTAALTHFPRR